MKCDILINAIGCIDGSFIDEAENYKPKRKMPAWIWAASAACLCVIVFGAAWLINRNAIGNWGNCTLELRMAICGKSEQGYVNYRELAEPGKVLITDELISLMDTKDKKCPNKYEYKVLIIDANGAAVPIESLSDIELSGEERMEFALHSCVSLTKKEIYSIKGSNDLALIIAPAVLSVDEEYLDTVDRDPLNVWISFEVDRFDEYEYMNEYDRLDSETRYTRIEEQLTRFFKEKYHVNVELDDEFKEFLDEYDSLDSDKRRKNFVKQMARLLYLEYAKLDIDGDPIKGYGGGKIDLDSDFQYFLRMERINKYIAEITESYGIDANAIKVCKENWGMCVITAELDISLIKEFLQDERTQGVFVPGVL